MNIANTVTDLIGNTPLVRINRINEGTGATIAAKAVLNVAPKTIGHDRRNKGLTSPNLDDKGRVVAVANPAVIDRSSEAVQRQIYERLRRKFDGPDGGSAPENARTSP